MGSSIIYFTGLLFYSIISKGFIASNILEILVSLNRLLLADVTLEMFFFFFLTAESDLIRLCYEYGYCSYVPIICADNYYRDPSFL